MKISFDTEVTACRDAVSCDLGGETAVLNIKDNSTTIIKGIGPRIWELIQSPKRVGELREIILGEYDVDRKECENDLLALLRDLIQRGLAEAVKPDAGEG